ncbi:uncharacterized protein HMPREF1541_07117 [Cyphellophora europaea CBS 101466]|uniref:Catalase core domain-containing protein n=1 Tax=Cyphellophora europaea (strain CBS 101466) TaxID=1220924 RepID=W2RMF2_CYPE1|nr:uncharacterized protein HMPREF1541_07117 [Cyphellophora europaea CBS 101466]ETN37495.1 hypothetical protein HMPREF1541_07117 [Cyphellophora europaea CBS 101466]
MSVENGETPKLYTLAEGLPQASESTIETLQTGSGGGYVLLTSTQLTENLAHFSRERIPERSVHAKAAGARGHFEVTDDVSDLTDADFLTGVGKKTEVLARISTVGPARGSADTVRDFRGCAIKFKTSEGNNDWVFNNQPVFFVRDPVKFSSMNRSHKPDPMTNTMNSDMFWDFHTNNQEGIHALMFLFGDRGIPSSVRHLNMYSGNTYTFTKADGSYRFVRIHILTNQGIKYLTNPEAAKLAGTNPDYHLEDLFQAIRKGEFPSWNVCVQVINPEDIGSAPMSVFDMTKIWPHRQYPLRKIGVMTLDTNPKNWFAEIEQAAFSPSSMVRGIAPSPDIMLQARMFAYPDASRYRIGVNYQFLPTNAAVSEVHCPIERDGFMNFTANYGDDPNYIGSAIKPLKFKSGKDAVKLAEVKGSRTLDQTDNGAPISYTSEVTDKDFEQATALWNLLAKQDGAQQRFVNNVAAHIAGVQRKWLRDAAFAMFRRVDKDLGDRIEKTTEGKISNQHEHPHKTAWH